MKNKYFPLVITIFIILFLDQITKLYIVSNFELHKSIVVIDGYFNITYIRNSGMAFGILSNLNGIITKIFFIAVSMIAIVAISILYRETPDENHLGRAAFSLILSGAIGNMIDRIIRGEVVDFLDFHWHEYHWPAFNVADSCITTGVGLLVIAMIVFKKHYASNTI